MAVSVKKKPVVTPNISSSLSMISNETEIQQPTQQEIQTGAPVTSLASELAQRQAPASMAVNTEQNNQIRKSSTKDTQIIFRTTEENKNYLKGFFATYGMTLSKGIQLACFYLEQQIKSGNVEINSAGIITKQERR